MLTIPSRPMATSPRTLVYSENMSFAPQPPDGMSKLKLSQPPPMKSTCKSIWRAITQSRCTQEQRIHMCGSYVVHALDSV